MRGKHYMAFIKKIDGEYVVCTRHNKRQGKIKPTDIIRVTHTVRVGTGGLGKLVLPVENLITLPKSFVGKKIRLIVKEVKDDAISTVQYAKA